MTSDPYAYWKAAKNAAIKGLPMPEASADDPQPGYYWMRRQKGGPRIPVLIKPADENGEVLARVGQDEGLVPAIEIWSWVAANAVSQEDAKQAFLTGTWPGDVQDVESLAAAGVGHNSVVSAQDMTLEERVESLTGRVTTLIETSGKFRDKERADEIANYRGLLTKLKSEIEVTHKAEKAPHLEAGREVDARYKPLVRTVEAATAQVRDALTAWNRRIAPPPPPPPPPPAPISRASDEAPFTPPPASAPAPAPKLGGQFGRRTGFKSVRRPEIKDYDAVLAHFARHPEVIEVVEKLVAQAVRVGGDLPGVEVTIEEVAA